MPRSTRDLRCGEGSTEERLVRAVEGWWRCSGCLDYRGVGVGCGSQPRMHHALSQFGFLVVVQQVGGRYQCFAMHSSFWGTMDHNLDYFTTVDQVKNVLNARPLNPAIPMEAKILEQSRLLSAWTGEPVEVVATNQGTCAHGPTKVVGVDLNQLSNIFSGFSGDQMDTALFFALAHEYGHVVQCSHVPATQWKQETDPRIQEAHADILGGVWMGVKFSAGEPRLPEHLRDVGFSLKSSAANYPSAYQRACLMRRGMADAVLLVEIVEPHVDDANYTRLGKALSASDVRDLLNTARNLLEYTPIEPPE